MDSTLIIILLVLITLVSCNSRSSFEYEPKRPELNSIVNKNRIKQIKIAESERAYECFNKCFDDNESFFPTPSKYDDGAIDDFEDCSMYPECVECVEMCMNQSKLLGDTELMKILDGVHNIF